MPNQQNNTNTTKPENKPIETIKVVYKGDVTWAGNIGSEEFILLKGEEYDLPATELVESLIGQNLLIKSTKK